MKLLPLIEQLERFKNQLTLKGVNLNDVNVCTRTIDEEDIEFDKISLDGWDTASGKRKYEVRLIEEYDGS